MKDYLLAIDQGTTSSRAVVMNRNLQPVAQAQQEFPQYFPADGWVEHEPLDWWRTVHACGRAALARAGIGAAQVAGIGITNQRETTVLWERATGKPLARGIVWQDRRTAEACERWREQGVEAWLTARTGLLLDPYFSASKLAWLLDHLPDARRRASRGELAFGTVDSYLLWQLTDGAVHATDETNAARTLLYDIHRHAWDEDLLALFDIPPALLPDVRPCTGPFGVASAEWFGAALPILGVAGDQQAALIGQACFTPGQAKITYGTGAFLMLNTGQQALASRHRLLSTPAYRTGTGTTYALEGSIFNAGAVVKWLRDQLHLCDTAADTERLARQRNSSRGVYLVPAFTGLGAPHWNPDARAAIVGLTRDSDAADMAVAGLESVCFQTRDLLDAVRADGAQVETLRVDGGMAGNDWFVQRLADLAGVPVARPANTESTVLGAAGLAALGAGWVATLEELADHWQCERHFLPEMPHTQAEEAHAGWLRAVARVM